MATLAERYFVYLKRLIGEGLRSKYNKLLKYLFEKEFTYKLDLDGNRYADGIELRYKFGYEANIPDAQIATELDDKPCSVLEMMIALANRCEEDIMSDPYYGNRTSDWFFTMIENLGLSSSVDIWFDLSYVEEVIDRFLNREYDPNGRGGLFVINNRKDLRGVEIWVQAMWYLDEVITESERR